MASRIGKIIKKYRKEKGYTQFKMAEKIVDGIEKYINYISRQQLSNNAIS